MLWYNNTFFVNRMANELAAQFQGDVIDDIFSTSKTDLFLVFGSNQSIHLRWVEGYLLIQLKDRKYLPGKNRLTAFEPMIGQRVEAIVGVSLSRAIELRSGGNLLVMKMFGRNSNVLLFKEGQFESRFIQKGNKDDKLTPEFIRKGFDQREFNKLIQTGRVDYLVEKRLIHPEMARAIEQRGMNSMEDLTDWLKAQSFQVVKSHSESGSIQVKLELSEEKNDFLQVADAFAREWSYSKAFNQKRENGIRLLEKSIKKTKKTIFAAQERLNQLSDSQHQNTGDLIMANLYNIKPEQKELNTTDFYTGEPVKIKLNPRLSPQKNAERYYRKAKNQHKEEENLNQRLADLEKELVQLQSELDSFNQAETLKSLKKLDSGQSAASTEQVGLPYRKYTVLGYSVLVGKSASDNDQLIKQYAHKEDWWFHARGVKGSHVILQCKDEGLSEELIEEVASLAAFYSKDKSSELVPVIYTKRKYVRKFKGAPPGAVKVDREQVVIVPPREAKK
jgi:predicted ribosome quality control (RQC) complex YloA/Tae2 family protein